jgi:hypothetical protein
LGFISNRYPRQFCDQGRQVPEREREREKEKKREKIIFVESDRDFAIWLTVGAEFSSRGLTKQKRNETLFLVTEEENKRSKIFLVFLKR